MNCFGFECNYRPQSTRLGPQCWVLTTSGGISTDNYLEPILTPVVYYKLHVLAGKGQTVTSEIEWIKVRPPLDLASVGCLCSYCPRPFVIANRQKTFPLWYKWCKIGECIAPQTHQFMTCSVLCMQVMVQVNCVIMYCKQTANNMRQFHLSSRIRDVMPLNSASECTS